LSDFVRCAPRDRQSGDIAPVSFFLSSLLSQLKPETLMTDVLVVGLDSWIIEDGNYGNFAGDAEVAFALEFHATLPLEEVEPNPILAPFLTRIGNADYEALGQVVHVADDWWVINVGILAFREEKPQANVRQGSWLRGKIFIGIDPFFYFERLAHQPSAPALIYDWKIEKIEVQTAPLIEVRPQVMARDPAQLGWKEIVETNAWQDAGKYLLHCSRLDGPRPPKGKRHP
jgi:hypothetical protein